MKTSVLLLFAAVTLTGATASFASGPAEARATATVEFDRPENFTDFSTSNFASSSDSAALAKEFGRQINTLAGSILPTGYHVILRFKDIDLAGAFEPERQPPNDQVRIMRGVYLPRLAIEYSVSDGAGNVVASGERNLTDVGYEFRLKTPPRSDTKIEAEMIGDFFREIRRTTA